MPAPSAQARRAALTLPLLVLLLAVVPFLPGLSGGFIGDDWSIIQLNPSLKSAARIPHLFAEPYWGSMAQGGLYRPLTIASYAVDRLVWGAGADGAPRAWGVHAGNLLLNAAAALLLFTILRQRWRDSTGAFWAAALFAVHPLHTEAVVHLVGRADVLMTALALLAWWLQACHDARLRRLAPLAFLAALLAKEMAAALPLLLLVDAALRAPAGSRRAALRAALPQFAAWCAALALFLVMRGVVLGHALTPPRAFALYVPGDYLAFEHPRPGEVLLTMTHAFGEYLRLFVWPVNLSSDYSGFPHATTLTAPVLLSAAALAAVAIAVLMAARRGRTEPLFWLAWAALAFAPVSNLLAMTGIVMAERVAYLPSVAVAAAGGAGAAWLVARRRALIALPTLLIMAGATLSWQQSKLWSDSRHLAEETLARARYAGDLTQQALVWELLREDDTKHDPALMQRALPLARAAAAARPNLTNRHYLARVLERLGYTVESLALWQSLLAERPDESLYRRQVLTHLDTLWRAAAAAGDTASARKWAEMGAATATQAAVRTAWLGRLKLRQLVGSGFPRLKENEP